MSSYRKRPWESDSDAADDAGDDDDSDHDNDPDDEGDSDNDDDPDDPDDSDDVDDDDDDPSGPFFKLMLELLLLRTLNARIFCLLMYHLGNMGVESMRQYGRKPGLPSGHYQRYLRRKLGVVFSDKGRSYKLIVPGKAKYTGSKVSLEMPVSAVWEEIDADLRADTGSRLNLEEVKESRQLPPTYFTNPVVQQYGSEEPVYPVSVFIDGLPYSQTDSVIAIWMINIINKKKVFGWGAPQEVFVCMRLSWLVQFLRCI